MPFLPNKTQFQSFLQSLDNQNYKGRESAYNNLLAIGLPTKRDEHWQYADLSKLLKTNYQLAYDKLQNIEKNTISEYIFEDSYRIVIVNGYIDLELSDSNYYNSIKITNNNDNLYLDDSSSSFMLMNKAFSKGGYKFEIKSNFVADKPIHILNIIDNESDSVQFHFNNRIIVGQNSQVTIAEEHINLSNIDSFLNTATQIQIDENSILNRTTIQNNSKSKIINHNFIEQKSSSSFKDQIINIGGDLVRNDINIQLNGENCQTDISGLSLLSGKDHIENYTAVNHNQPNSSSNQLYKYILNDKSEGVFNGLVKVRKDAQKTDSQQSNKNILLSKNALMNSNPQLEIYADDVKCSHGSATGELDDDAIFYLRSRGINLKSAQALLIEGFAKEVINKIDVESVKEKLNAELIKWLAK